MDEFCVSVCFVSVYFCPCWVLLLHEGFLVVLCGACSLVALYFSLCGFSCRGARPLGCRPSSQYDDLGSSS